MYVPLKETVADVRAILDGGADQLQPEDFLYIATLKDLESKLKSDVPTNHPAPQQAATPQQAQSPSAQPTNQPQTPESVTPPPAQPTQQAAST